MSIIQLILSLLGVFLHWYGASEDVLANYVKLIESTHNDGLISIGTKDKLLEQRAKILARVKAKKEGKIDSAPPKA